ncbi:MAG: VWA domain-containing protein, partial [Gammaproteobacteria bacterium]|nr:VWA domain-containing protein [Gammaproteobacteria bacterium]
MRHMKSGNQIRTFMFAAVTILFAKALTAGNALDSVIAMDSSGSMKKTDPEELRKPAAKLFINLLNDDDQLSVIS